MCHYSVSDQHGALIEGITLHYWTQQKAEGSRRVRSINTRNQMSVTVHYIIHFEEGGKEKTSSQRLKEPYSVIMFVGENRLDWLYAFTIMSCQSIITLQSRHNLWHKSELILPSEFLISRTLCCRRGGGRGCGGVVVGRDRRCEWQTGGWYPATAVAAALIRDSQRFLLMSGAARFGSGADDSYKTAGAGRQTDRQGDVHGGRGGHGAGRAGVSALFMQRIVLQREAPDSPPADWCGFISRGCGSSD